MRDEPYAELSLFGDQQVDEGPFLSIEKKGNTQDGFRVMSFGVNAEKPCIAMRRRKGMAGSGRPYRGDEIDQMARRDEFARLQRLYTQRFEKEK